MDNRVYRRERIIFGVLVLLLVVGGVWRAVEHSTPVQEFSKQEKENREGSETKETLITVHLVGAVVSPGVYHLPAGSRVYELVKLAGGFEQEADQEAVNQARPLFDGEQVYIYSIGEKNEHPAGRGSGKININRATVSELTALPGIGEVRAAQIVEYREKNGLFKDIREIMDVSGIGLKTFESIAELITVY